LLEISFLFVSRYVELRWRRGSEIREPEAEDAVKFLAIIRCVLVERLSFSIRYIAMYLALKYGASFKVVVLVR
jgi:hypothetical protein